MSDVDLNRKVFAMAPQVTSAKFTDTGAQLIVAFDHAIATAQLDTCSAIFSTGVNTLGTSPSCVWTDGRHLEISPDVDGTIEPSNTMTFQTDVIKRDQLYSKVLNSQLTFLAPANPVTPVPVIVGKLQRHDQLDHIYRVLHAHNFFCVIIKNYTCNEFHKPKYLNDKPSNHVNYLL